MMIDDQILDVPPLAAPAVRYAFGRLFAPKVWLAIGKSFDLTPRELQVAILLAKGCTIPELAAKLEISAGTAYTHVCSLRKITRSASARQAVVKLILASGLIHDAGDI